MDYQVFQRLPPVHHGLSPDLWDVMGSHDSGEEFGQIEESITQGKTDTFFLARRINFQSRCSVVLGSSD